MTTALPERTTPLLSPGYRWATVGMVSLVFLAAFENLAVTTVMATVAADLDGRSWFSVAFSATLAASVVGMVAGGLYADRRGAVPSLLASVGIFVAGLVVAGVAPGIEIFVAARFLQGLGSGAMTVSLYVLVAHVYEPVDRPRIFGAFAAAWVLPSMIGPPVAGAVATTVGWRWVFLGVVVLSAAATAALGPALREARATPVTASTTADGPRRLLLAVAVAAAVVSVDLAARLSGTPGRVLALVGVLGALAAVRPLLPTGSLRARRGLPSVVLLRGLVAAAFSAAEIHVPYLLQTRYDAPPWLAGLVLTVGALGWAGASQVQGRMGARLSHVEALRAGSLLLLAGLAAQLVVVAFQLPAVLVPVAWVAAGAGMGLMYPRISSYVLGVSAPAERGTNTAAMSIGDAVGGATAIAITGLVFTTLGTETWTAFTGVFAATTMIAVLAVVVSRRTATP
ncbi:MAG: MFS transporter [Nocardioides sp.]|nr:MFS transporter [Nocardioides sp.]